MKIDHLEIVFWPCYHNYVRFPFKASLGVKPVIIYTNPQHEGRWYLSTASAAALVHIFVSGSEICE